MTLVFSRKRGLPLGSPLTLPATRGEEGPAANGGGR
jgi:hypothetical protein